MSHWNKNYDREKERVAVLEERFEPVFCSKKPEICDKPEPELNRCNKPFTFTEIAEGIIEAVGEEKIKMTWEEYQDKIKYLVYIDPNKIQIVDPPPKEEESPKVWDKGIIQRD